MLEIATLQARLCSTKFLSFPFFIGDSHTVRCKVPPLANHESEKGINPFQEDPLTYTSQPGPAIIVETPR